MDAARCMQGLGSPFRQPRSKALARRIKAAFGRPFLWFLSFGRAKERNSPAGAGTGIKSSFAAAKHLPKPFQRWVSLHSTQPTGLISVHKLA